MPRPLRPSTTQLWAVRRRLFETARVAVAYDALRQKGRELSDIAHQRGQLKTTSHYISQPTPERWNDRFYIPLTNRGGCASTGDVAVAVAIDADADADVAVILRIYIECI